MADQKKTSTAQDVISGFNALQGLVEASKRQSGVSKPVPAATPTGPGLWDRMLLGLGPENPALSGLKDTLYGQQTEDSPGGMHQHFYSPSGSTPGTAMPEEEYQAGRDSVLDLLRKTQNRPANWHPADVNLPIR